MEEIALTSHVMKVLKPALHGAKGTIKNEIKRGISWLYLTSNKALYLVLRPESNQLVVVAAAGARLKDSAKEIIAFAQQKNFEFIRFHTKNPAYLKKGLAGLPLYLIETRKALFNKNEYIYLIDLREV